MAMPADKSIFANQLLLFEFKSDKLRLFHFFISLFRRLKISILDVFALGDFFYKRSGGAVSRFLFFHTQATHQMGG